MNRYDYLKFRGICVLCGKEKVWEDTTMCIECLDKHKERCEKTRSEASKEQRRKYVKRKRNLCIAFGICRECFKREVKVGLKCIECHAKEINRNKKRRTEIPREIRPELKMCYFCGEPVKKGKKVCEKHYNICCKNIAKGYGKDNSNHYWRKVETASVKKYKWEKEHNKLNKDKEIIGYLNDKFR